MDMSASDPLVRANGLVVRRGGRVILDELTFDVARGRITGLLGPSGCGKTTLMRALVGVQARVSGRLRILGEPAGTPALRRRVGYMTQIPSIYGDITVRENLTYFAAMLGVARGEIDPLLKTVDLAGEADRRVDTLSGGQRARVSLACALLGEP